MFEHRSVIRVPMAHVIERAAERPPGYVEDVIAHGTPSGDFVELDLAAWHKLRQKYGPPKDPGIMPPPPAAIPPAIPTHSGPGSFLHQMLGKIGLEATPHCACLARMREMDARGPDWCTANMDTIVGWLGEEAGRRGLPFNRLAARALVKAAIWRARRAPTPPV